MEVSTQKRTVLILATLDTKSEEVRYIRARIKEAGLNTLVMDAGIMGEPKGITPDIPAAHTAQAAGTSLEALRKKGVRGLAIEEMLKGVEVLTARLYSEGRIHGAISLGGAEGGVMAAAAMQLLPPGFPKIIITPLASGLRPFKPFVGIRDIMVMHSLVDIAGVNDISRTVFDNASAAIVGMVQRYRPVEAESRNLVAVTTLGTTEKAVRTISAGLKAAGYEPVVFHSSGVGGQVMEDMIRRGFFLGVVDLCTNEITDHLVGGYHDAGPHRLEAAAQMGVPQVVSTACMDFFAQGPMNAIPERWRGRKMYYHNPYFTLVRPSVEEMAKVGETLARKLNAAIGPVRVVFPLRGMSFSGLPGGSTYDPEGDRALFEAIRRELRSDIPIIEVDAHVNEEPFAQRMVTEFLSVAGRR